jgi:hypothetical protein
LRGGTSSAKNGRVNVQERRRFVRYVVNVEFELVAGALRHRGETRDLGAGGCRIEVPAAIERGLAVEIRLSSPRTSLVVSGAAVVAWASHAAPFHAGLAFSDEVAEQVIPFMQALLGAVKLRNQE